MSISTLPSEAGRIASDLIAAYGGGWQEPGVADRLIEAAVAEMAPGGMVPVKPSKDTASEDDPRVADQPVEEDAP